MRKSNKCRDLKNLPFIQNLLSQNAEVYLVGGSVRDQLLNSDLKDFDLVVRNLDFDKLVAQLKKNGVVNLVGKSFGIIKFIPKTNPDGEFDIALPRTESSTGQGHRDFHIDFDPVLPLEQDLKRRDFTINAMALDVATNTLIDPFNGQKDLQEKQIRMVFENSFVEDPLRLMRAIQFAARLDFHIEKNTFAQIQKHAALIETVSKERIIEEVRKLFSAPKPSVGFDLMRDTGLLQFVFPDIDKTIGVIQPKKNNEDVYSHTMKVLDAARKAEELEKPGNLDIMFSALFHDTGKPITRREQDDNPSLVTFYNHQHISTGIAWRWLKDFKARTIGVDPKHICHLVKHHMFETKEFHNEKAVRRFIRKVGKENVFDLLDLRLADKKGGRFPKKVYGIVKLRETIREEINKKPPFTPKDLALTGHDIMALGYKAGPVIGLIQRFLMEHVIEDPSLNTKEGLTELIEKNRSLWTTKPLK